MIGPLSSDGVWLKHGWARTAHRLIDNTNWPKSPCGLFMQRTRGSGITEQEGEIIRWDSLDQQRVELCKVCWKGYTPVDSRTVNELKWWDAQRERVAEIFQEAWVVVSIPTHLDQMKLDGPGGNVVHVDKGSMSSTMLNYETLKEMLRIMLQEETHRKASRERMVKLMEALAGWEHTHRYGEPIVEEPESAELEAGSIAETLFGK